MTFLACLEFFPVEMPKGVKNQVVGHLAGRVAEALIGGKMYPDWRIRSLFRILDSHHVHMDYRKGIRFCLGREEISQNGRCH